VCAHSFSTIRSVKVQKIRVESARKVPTLELHLTGLRTLEGRTGADRISWVSVINNTSASGSAAAGNGLRQRLLDHPTSVPSQLIGICAAQTGTRKQY
jgi:hypothetical protein